MRREKISSRATGRLLLVACLALSLAAFFAGPGTAGAQTSEVPPTCPGSLQAKIDAAVPGSTVNLADNCVYRETLTADRPLTLDGGGGGAVRGSDVWRDWRKNGAGWTSVKAVPSLEAPDRYRCEGPDRRCGWPEQVFVDGRPLTQVASGPGAGEFALDAGRRVVLGGDPSGRTVEVTVRERWLVGTSDDVTVEGVEMRHAGLDGLWNGGYSGWTVRGNDLSHAHAKNLALTLGDALVAEDNDVHHAGQLGIGSNDARVEILSNRVYENNTEGFDPGWEAGGMKVAQAKTARISGNEVHHNGDIGIWTDVVNGGQDSVEVSGNRVHHHPRQGIRVEITKNFAVHDNVLWENGWGEGDSYTGAGIVVAGSRDGTVEGNVLAWNASGIGVVQQDRRGPEEQSYDATTGIVLKGNRVVVDEDPGASNRAAVFWNEDPGAVAAGAPGIHARTAANTGAGGAYWYDGAEGRTTRFKWAYGIGTLAAYNATPAEKDGRYLTDAEKTALLEENGMPGAPENNRPASSGSDGFVAVVAGMIGRVLEAMPW